MRKFLVVGLIAAAVLTFGALLSCQGEDEPVASTTSASTGTDEGSAEVIAEPVPPPDFEGDPNASLPLTAEESAALARARALSEARNPTAQSPIDRGFAKAPVISGVEVVP